MHQPEPEQEPGEALRDAARRGDLDSAKAAFQAGDVAAEASAIGLTALHFAAQHGHTLVCEYLLEQRGVDVEAADKHGRTAVQLAAVHGHETTVAQLQRFGAVLLPEKAEQMAAALAKREARLALIQSLGGNMEAVRVEERRLERVERENFTPPPTPEPAPAAAAVEEMIALTPPPRGKKKTKKKRGLGLSLGDPEPELAGETGALLPAEPAQPAAAQDDDDPPMPPSRRGRSHSKPLIEVFYDDLQTTPMAPTPGLPSSSHSAHSLKTQTPDSKPTSLHRRRTEYEKRSLIEMVKQAAVFKVAADDDAFCEAVADKLSSQTYEPDEFILVKDCPSTGIYLIEDGSVEIYNRLYAADEGLKTAGSVRGNPDLSWADVSRTNVDGSGLIMPLATLHPGDVIGLDALEFGAAFDNYAVAGGNATKTALTKTLKTYDLAAVRERAMAAGVDDEDLQAAADLDNPGVVGDAKHTMIELIVKQELGKFQTHVKYLCKEDLLALFGEYEETGTLVRASIEALSLERKGHTSVSGRTAFWTYPMEHDDEHPFPDGHPLHKDSKRHLILTVGVGVLPTGGALPFLLPLAVNLMICGDGTGSVSTSPSTAEEVTVYSAHRICAELDQWPFFYLSALWWVGTTLFLFEFLHIQFGRIGFGKGRYGFFHYFFCIAGSSVTLAGFEFLEWFTLDETNCVSDPSTTDQQADSDGMLLGEHTCSAVKLWAVAMLKVIIAGWPHYLIIIYFATRPYFKQYEETAKEKVKDKVGEIRKAISDEYEAVKNIGVVPVFKSSDPGVGVFDNLSAAEPEPEREPEPVESPSSKKKMKKKKKTGLALAVDTDNTATLDQLVAQMARDDSNNLRPETHNLIDMTHTHNLMAMNKQRDRARRWRSQSQKSAKAQKAMLRSAMWLGLGIMIIIGNWTWLQLLIGLYSAANEKYGATAGKNVSFSFLFSTSEMVLKQLMSHVFKKAEGHRLGTANTTFDRYQLANLVSMATAIITAVYRQSLFIQQTDFGMFIALAIPSMAVKVGWYAMQMTDWWALSDQFPELQSHWHEATRNSKIDTTWGERTVWVGRISTEHATQAKVKEVFVNMDMGEIDSVLVKRKKDQWYTSGSSGERYKERSWAVVTFKRQKDAERAIFETASSPIEIPSPRSQNLRRGPAADAGAGGSTGGIAGTATWLVTHIKPEKKEKLHAGMVAGHHSGKIVAFMIYIMHFGASARPDVTNKRGRVCFGAFLHFVAVWISGIQYLTFLVGLRLYPLNLPLFREYSDVINIDQDPVYEDLFVQQLQFIALFLFTESALYFVTNTVSKFYVKSMSPHYVGACHCKEFPRFRVSIVLIGAHIVSDVYLGILLTKQQTSTPI